jgi:hypothetical protein
MGISWLTNAICFFSWSQFSATIRLPGPREVQRAVCSVAGFKIKGLRGPADVEKCDTPWMPWMVWCPDEKPHIFSVSFLQICSSHYDNQVLKLVASLVIGTLRAFFSTPRTTQVPGWAPYLLVENSCAPPIFWFKKHPFMVCHWRWRILGDDEM